MPNKGVLIGLGIVALLLVLYVLFRAIFRFIPDYKRLGVYRGGVFIGDKGPGVYLTLPLLDRVRYVDIRIQKVQVDEHTFIARDGNPVVFSVVCFYHIENTYAYLNRIFDFEGSFKALLIAELTMAVTKYDQAAVISQLQQIQEDALARVQEVIEPWGGVIQTLAFKDLALPDSE